VGSPQQMSKPLPGEPVDVDAFAAVAALAGRQYGLVTWDQALAAGLSPAAIRRLSAQGHLVRAARGLYRFAGFKATWRSRLMAACLQAGRDAVVSHRSAAALWRLRGLRAPAHHRPERSARPTASYREGACSPPGRAAPFLPGRDPGDADPGDDPRLVRHQRQPGDPVTSPRRRTPTFAGEHGGVDTLRPRNGEQPASRSTAACWRSGSAGRRREPSLPPKSWIFSWRRGCRSRNARYGWPSAGGGTGSTWRSRGRRSPSNVSGRSDTSMSGRSRRIRSATTTSRSTGGSNCR
jgi:hypothetical protein